MMERASETLREKLLSIARETADQHIGRPSDAHLRITEGRDDWVDSDGVKHTFAWCGEYVSYCLYQAGYRSHFINRVEMNGTWRIGENIESVRQAGLACGAIWQNKDAYARYALGVPGDIIIFQRAGGGHICFLDERLTDKEFVTLDGNGIGGTTRRTPRSLETEQFLAIVSPVAMDQGQADLYKAQQKGGPYGPDTSGKPKPVAIDESGVIDAAVDGICQILGAQSSAFYSAHSVSTFSKATIADSFDSLPNTLTKGYRT